MDPVTIVTVVKDRCVVFDDVSKHVEFQQKVKEQLGRGRVVLLHAVSLAQEELRSAGQALTKYCGVEFPEPSEEKTEVSEDLNVLDQILDAADAEWPPASGNQLEAVVVSGGRTVIDLPSVHNVAPLGQVEAGKTYVVRSELKLTPGAMESLKKQFQAMEAITKARFVIFDSNLQLEELDRNHPLFGQLGSVKTD